MPAESKRLGLDPTRCEGVGLCAVVAPALIELDRWGFPLLHNEKGHPRRAAKQARRAIRACPHQALHQRG